MEYRKRVLETELKSRLSSMGAVVIEGPRACGKTSTARRFAASEVLLDVDRNARQAIAVDPALVLDGAVPRLIDEWQIEPEIWNHIRRTVDDRGRPGQFILTGSAVPADDVTRHTGAGRLVRIMLRPMTLYETGDATGEVSLRSLFEGDHARCRDPELTIADIADLAARGGWPGYLDLTVSESVESVRAYLEEIRRVDIPRTDQVTHDPDRVGRLLSSLARNVARYAGISTLATDTGGVDGTLARTTVRAYLSTLERLMIIEDQPAWAPHLRSRSRLRKASKRLFVDPSLAVAALRSSPKQLMQDLELFGFIFESLVIRDLRVFAQAIDASVFQYQDNTGLEVDAIVQTTGGRWAAFEIKLGQGRVEEGAANLLKFRDKVDTARCGSPQLLAVIVGTGFGYTRDDGISVIPIGALGP
ncbi:ATP-binding protein [Gemmatimonadota bacterium]